ncbi:hypothetical protein [Pseudomonas typographi]|uniref:Lipoprotein n=1 Tax=Pseudomonas typographi TaxID=2715964 RepID=A0ABR7Z6I0_9PSED|nr:hypothetical protein [Pseudomonas typographi]
MNKWWFPALASLALLHGCASVPQGSIPVVDQGQVVSNGEGVAGNRGASTYRQPAAQPQAAQQGSDVQVMVPQGSSSQPITTGTAAPLTTGAGFSTGPGFSSSSAPAAPAGNSGAANSTTATAPTGIPGSNSAGGGLAADEQLDGPVLALLTTAQQQQGGGDLNGASSSLERAQRIAPREPQVLFRLAQVRLAQGDAGQAEQLSRRALTYANGRPDLQASLWETIAQARTKQGDAAGAAQARQQAKVNL